MRSKTAMIEDVTRFSPPRYGDSRGFGIDASCSTSATLVSQNDHGSDCLSLACRSAGYHGDIASFLVKWATTMVHFGVVAGTIWDVSKLRLHSVKAPFDASPVAGEAARLLCRAEASGMWDPPSLVTRLDSDVFGQALKGIADCGIATSRVLEWTTYAEKGSDDFGIWIRGIRSQLDENPVPSREMPKLAEVLGPELKDLLGISNSAMQRYRHESRDVPDDVAWRGHVLAGIVGDLAGSYNERGIRGWFKRRRPQLGGPPQRRSCRGSGTRRARTSLRSEISPAPWWTDPRMAESSSAGRARLFRACDVRFPFLWTSAEQSPGRWHGPGEGPCHYLTTSAKGAWAEVIRHEAITEPEDLEDLRRALWAVEAPLPEATPELANDVMTGDSSTYPQCQAAAREFRAKGVRGLVAPSAALLSGLAEQLTLEESGRFVEESYPSEVVALFAPVRIVGTQLAEGSCAASVLRGHSSALTQVLAWWAWSPTTTAPTRQPRPPSAAAWSRDIAETIETLDFAAEFEAMGSPYSEADAQGHVLTHVPPTLGTPPETSTRRCRRTTWQ